MAKKRSATPELKAAQLSTEQMRKAVPLINRRIDELRALNVDGRITFAPHAFSCLRLCPTMRADAIEIPVGSNASGAPMTYALDGRQYIVFAVGGGRNVPEELVAVGIRAGP